MTDGQRGLVAAGVLAVIGFALTIQQGAQGTREHKAISRADSLGRTRQQTSTNAALRALYERLSGLLSAATANAAEASGDYREYMVTPVAQADVTQLVAMVDRFGNRRNTAVSAIRRQLGQIRDAYVRAALGSPSLPLEQVRVQGTVLSHRRQMAVLAEVLRRSSNQPSDVALVRSVETALAP